jgi:DNA repair photolyase
MPLNKVKPGSNMYSWVTHTHNHLAGACPHQCKYCYVSSMARRFPAMHDRYSGALRLIENELSVTYGAGKTIFVENCSDLFAEGIPGFWIMRILRHCHEAPENDYVFQTKNPGRVERYLFLFPPHFRMGVTAESNRPYPTLSEAPSAESRTYEIRKLKIRRENVFVTVEPILKFDPDLFFAMLLQAKVGRIFIGADSKGHGLPEPTGMEIRDLVKALRKAGKKVVLKSNLKRLYQGD